MSFPQSACDRTAMAREHRRLVRESPTAARCAQGRRPWFLVAVLGFANVLSVAQGASSSAEHNWPQWRGPLQSGVAPHADPPTEWSETKNIKWKVRIPGEGSATPVIWENKVFVLTAVPTGKRVEPKPDDASSGSPGGPGGRGGRGGFGCGQKQTEVQQFVILCLDRQTGKVLWQQTAREEVPHE